MKLNLKILRSVGQCVHPPRKGKTKTTSNNYLSCKVKELSDMELRLSSMKH